MIELLVVIAVLAILSGLLLLAWRKVREAAASRAEATATKIEFMDKQGRRLVEQMAP